MRIPKELKIIIFEFKNGDRKYYREKFKFVLRDIQFCNEIYVYASENMGLAVGTIIGALNVTIEALNYWGEIHYIKDKINTNAYRRNPELIYMKLSEWVCYDLP